MKSLCWAITGLAVAYALPPGWGEHGHGIGPIGSHGAPPNFSSPQATTARPIVAPALPNSAIPNHAATRVSANPALSGRIQPVLPAGMGASSAASGFASQARFLEALHVSNDLGIPFNQLKAEMTGSDHDSLARAIHELRPDMDREAIKNSVKTARGEARQDLRSSAASPAGVSSRIAQHPVLDTRVVALLPAGMSLQSAAAGFTNTGQFIAALHVARNLNIPFSRLKAEVTSGVPLGQAIADLRPALTPGVIRADLRLAERQAKQDLGAGDEVELVSER
ncbi:MAG: hypothetical protein C5B51_28030 [Terriglobia bacterium]|nr:MAG: hypothetical protein C5B51_28030 [Terriglobia bacterium]